MSILLAAEETADLEMLQRGGKQAHLEFFERYRSQLENMARLRIDPRLKRRISDADIVQEVFLVYQDAFTTYLSNPVCPPKVWLRRLARQVIWRVNRHHIGRQCRDLRRESDLETLSDFGIRELSDSLSSVGRKIDRKQLQVKMRELVSKMPRLEREILTLVHFEEQTIREAAMELGIQYEAAKKRHRRSLKRLKKSHEASLQEYLR